LRLSSAMSGGYWTSLFMNFTVVLDFSSSCCCHRLCERSFSYYAPEINDTILFSGKLNLASEKELLFVRLEVGKIAFFIEGA
jgi:hypothetical protein